MKKLKLRALEFGEVLSRAQMKNVLGGESAPGGGGGCGSSCSGSCTAKSGDCKGKSGDCSMNNVGTCNCAVVC